MEYSHWAVTADGHAQGRIVPKKTLTLQLSLRKNKLHQTKIKGALSGLRKFLALENPLKMMKNAFYFT